MPSMSKHLSGSLRVANSTITTSIVEVILVAVENILTEIFNDQSVIVNSGNSFNSWVINIYHEERVSECGTDFCRSILF